MDKKAKLFKLYVDGFDKDGREYAKFFFEHGFIEADAMINRQATSGLHIKYKQIFYADKSVIFPFLVAVSTLKARRGSGEIKELIKEALLRLKAENHPFIGLYPFRHDYYTKYGFITIDKAVDIAISPDIYSVSQQLTPELIENNIEDYYRLYTDFCKLFDIYLVKSRADIAFKLEGMLMDDTEMIHYMSGDKMVGYRLFAEGLLEDLAGCGDDCKVVESADDNVQCRVLDIKVALESYRYLCKDCDIELNIQDDMLNGSIWNLRVQDGKATARQLALSSKNSIVMTAAELTVLLMSGVNAKTYGLDHIFKTVKVFLSDKY